MGIYIKGDFDLPQNGGYKEIHIFDNGRVWWLFKDGGQFEGKWIPVPDHGDLVEKETVAAILKLAFPAADYDGLCRATQALQWLSDAPVVIPAERSEE